VRLVSVLNAEIFFTRNGSEGSSRTHFTGLHRQLMVAGDLMESRAFVWGSATTLFPSANTKAGSRAHPDDTLDSRETGRLSGSQHLCLKIERPGIGARGQLRQSFQVYLHVQYVGAGTISGSPEELAIQQQAGAVTRIAVGK
jgi:hypothetical protein